LHLSRQRDIPSGRSSVKQHSSRQRDIFVLTPICVQKLRTVPGCIHLNVSATRPDVFQCSTSKRISFPNTDLGRQLQPPGRRSYSVRTLSLIRQNVQKSCNRLMSVYTGRTLSPYYGNCMQQKCNSTDARATPSGQGFIQERISGNLESRLHSCPSGRRLEKIDLNSF